MKGRVGEIGGDRVRQSPLDPILISYLHFDWTGNFGESSLSDFILVVDHKSTDELGELMFSNIRVSRTNNDDRFFSHEPSSYRVPKTTL